MIGSGYFSVKEAFFPMMVGLAVGTLHSGRGWSKSEADEVGLE